MNNKGYSDRGLGIIYRVFAKHIAKKLAKTKITPNQITIIGGFLGLISALFFSFGYQLYLIIGIILLQLRLLFDFIDGELAHAKSMCTPYGDWLDSIFDRIVDPFVFFGICWGAYNLTGNTYVWIIGFIAIASCMLIETFVKATEMSFPDSTGMIINEVDKNAILSTIAYSRVNIYFLLTIAILLNQIFLYLIIVSIYGLTFYFGAVLYFNRKFRNII